MNITPIFAYYNQNHNFGNRKIENFTKMDLVLAILHGETLESFALRHKCSVGTVKRRKAEWGITIQQEPGYHSRIELPLEELVRSNNPDIQPENVCVDNHCSIPTLQRRKKDYHIPKRKPKKTPELSKDDFQRIYSHDVRNYLNNSSEMSKSTFYRKAAKSNIVTPRKLQRQKASEITSIVVRRMLNEGKTPQEIADFYDVSCDTIRRYIRTNNIQID